ncbi:MAG: Lrp/AsnC family transcriptional regulator [Deltaproteobacteria bacterium]|nr:Lrp/AsnC family transcriptional regulator [Deltaproteobacteria bacterium]
MEEQLSDALRNELIRSVQAGVPLVDRPFAEIAGKLGLGEEGESAVRAQLERLSEEEVLREISAVLEGSVLGYDSALVAGVVPGASLERVVEAVNAHPTVTHNYLRNHHYNLWFTIAVPPEMKLEKTLELLAGEGGVEAFLPLRRTHTFKIGVNFDPETLKNSTQAVKPTSVSDIDVSERDALLFRTLQTPLPFVERPFDALAEKASAGGEQVKESELLEFAGRHLGGAIRRYVGTLRHRKLGVRENGMAVWRVAEKDVEAAGLRLAAAPEVSHCYARNAIEGFPYTLYSMTHGPSRESCHEVARRLSKETGIEDYAVLFSEREFKKLRLRYFLPELDTWWTARACA